MFTQCNLEESDIVLCNFVEVAMHWLLYRSLMTFVLVYTLRCFFARPRKQMHLLHNSSTYYPHNLTIWENDVSRSLFAVSQSPDVPGMVINLCDLLSRSIQAARWWPSGDDVAMIAVKWRVFQHVPINVWNRTTKSCVLQWQISCVLMCILFSCTQAVPWFAGCML